MAIDFSKYINSKTTHYISNSGSDERGKLHGGKAGDQTGKEWQLKSWYSRPWTCVLRYPNAEVRDMIAKFAIEAALNNNIGYNQYKRYTYWDQLVKAGYDPSKIVAKCDEDCTAGVTANVKAVGHVLGIKALEDLPKTIRSSNMKSNFKKAGFEVLTDKKYLSGYNYLLPGDILLCENHHAATNVTIGKYAKATNDEPIASTPSADLTDIAGYVACRHGNYYIRTAPKKDASIIDIVHDGDNIPYLGETKDGWNKVLASNGKIGWISHKAGDVVATKVETYTVKSGNWYVRKSPDSTGEKLGVAHGGETLISAGLDTDGWNMVVYDGQTGWISKRAIA